MGNVAASRHRKPLCLLSSTSQDFHPTERPNCGLDAHRFPRPSEALFHQHTQGRKENAKASWHCPAATCEDTTLASRESQLHDPSLPGAPLFRKRATFRIARKQKSTTAPGTGSSSHLTTWARMGVDQRGMPILSILSWSFRLALMQP
jgi:hypothetical protein